MENVFSPSLHMGLKRDLSTEQRDSSDNITLIDGPLFERYQFLSPGLSFFITYIHLYIVLTKNRHIYGCLYRFDSPFDLVCGDIWRLRVASVVCCF